jgi:transcriptional regulator with XRE-family HTH domain
MTDPQLTFGEYVRRLRIARGWTQVSLCTRDKIHSQTLSGIEKRNAPATLNVVVALAKALDADLATMLELSGCLPPEVMELVRQKYQTRTFALT